MLIEKDKFLQILHSVQAGIVNAEVEQGKCFAFKDNRVMTFSGEVLCRRKCPLELTGAVEAKPLLSILGLLSDEQVDVSVLDNHLIIKGRGSTKIRMEAEVNLPVEVVDYPKEWQDLPEDFSNAISIVSQCASNSKNPDERMITCVHLHPEWMEASDRYQLCRYPLKMDLRKSILVKKDALKSLVNLGMESFGETENWIHFKNSSGLRVSCRRYLMEFPDLSEHLSNAEGDTITFPKGLTEVIPKAEVFASSKDSSLISLKIEPGKVIIKGEGVYGSHRETRKIHYNGPELMFWISSKILADLAKKFSEAVLVKNKLLVDAGNYKFLVYLRKSKEPQ